MKHIIYLNDTGLWETLPPGAEIVFPLAPVDRIIDSTKILASEKKNEKIGSRKPLAPEARGRHSRIHFRLHMGMPATYLIVSTTATKKNLERVDQY